MRTQLLELTIVHFVRPSMPSSVADQTPPQPPVPPTPPQPPALSVGGNTVGGQSALQALEQLVNSLDARGSELSNQLRSVTERRDALSRDIRRASQDSRPGLQAQRDQLNQRVLQIEQDISTNGIAKAKAKADLAAARTSSHVGSSWLPNGANDMDMTAISVVFTLFVLCPIAIAAARLLWKRGSRPAPPPASRESELRMERVEQAVDAIAVEVERISEGQRFVTQVLSKGMQSPALGVGQPPAEPLKVPLNETVMAGVNRQGSR